MSLVAARLLAQPTLVRCVTEGYRVMAGEPDTGAVRTLQRSLLGLGYDTGGVDGQFTEATSQALVDFKTDEGLSPNDPVASTGTVGRLDTYYADEPADPDLPDPSTTGLVELLGAAMETAGTWLDLAVADVAGGSPDMLQRVEALFHTSRTGDPDALSSIHDLLAMARRAVRGPDPFLMPVALDRTAWGARADYLPLARTPAAELWVTPPFRNVLDDLGRAVLVVRLAVGATGQADAFAIPASPRDASLPGSACLANSAAYAAFAAHLATGELPAMTPRWSWPTQ